MKSKVQLELTRPEFYALFSIVQERFLASQRPNFEGIDHWVDLTSDQTITIEDLLALLSKEI